MGYYRQDFSELNFNHTVWESLSHVCNVEHTLRSTAAGFLLSAELMQSRVGNLSEGQKGLLAFARIVLMRPSLLVLDEPTNHINFRHLPVIARALDTFEGGLLLVSHDKEFVKKLTIDQQLDLGSLL